MVRPVGLAFDCEEGVLLGLGVEGGQGLAVVDEEVGGHRLISEVAEVGGELLSEGVLGLHFEVGVIGAVVVAVGGGLRGMVHGYFIHSFMLHRLIIL